MTEVKRYDITGDKYGDGTVMQSEFGQVVFFEDYAALQQKLDAVLAENVAMKSFVQKECCVYRSGMVVNAEAYFPETPATDAILNAVRAEGVHSFIGYLGELAREYPKATVAKSLEITELNAESFISIRLLRADAPKGGSDDK